MLDPKYISDLLRSRLTRGTKVRVYHISTPPTPCPPLYAPGPGRSEEPTTLESHFLALSQTNPQTEIATDSPSDIIVLGVEVLIFATTSLTTVFVSKADSTGFLTKSSGAHVQSASLARTAITSFLECLLSPRLSQTRVVLSLFARSQNQYLFPGSIENATKHVLDDRQLIKWWCRVLNPLTRQDLIKNSSTTVQAYVVVPGCDKAETRAFFPVSARSDPASSPLWLSVYPVDLLVDDTALPPRCLVPRLPDDPKARFLEDLDDHGIDDGHWRNVKTLDQFWEMMSYRQECSAGRLVGFVWLVFSPIASPRDQKSVLEDVSARNRQQHLSLQPAKDETELTTKVPGDIKTSRDPMQGSLDKPLEGANYITPKTIALATAPSELNSMPTGGLPSSSSDRVPNTVRDTDHTGSATAVDRAKSVLEETQEVVILTADDYQDAMDALLHLDFAGTEMALKSTRTWREKVETLAGLSHLGILIKGEGEVEERHDTSSLPPNAVNVLTGVRKKRKMQSDDTSKTELVEERPPVNTLATNLVRKKAKP